jgi:pSer/pThr/pTyr-binding forkhead associated (FHA) protein
MILPAGMTALDAAKQAFSLKSSQLRDAFAHGGVKVNGEPAAADHELAEGDLLQFGKTRVVRVKHG